MTKGSYNFPTTFTIWDNLDPPANNGEINYPSIIFNILHRLWGPLLPNWYHLLICIAHCRLSALCCNVRQTPVVCVGPVSSHQSLSSLIIFYSCFHQGFFPDHLIFTYFVLYFLSTTHTSNHGLLTVYWWDQQVLSQDSKESTKTSACELDDSSRNILFWVHRRLLSTPNTRSLLHSDAENAVPVLYQEGRNLLLQNVILNYSGTDSLEQIAHEIQNAMVLSLFTALHVPSSLTIHTSPFTVA